MRDTSARPRVIGLISDTHGLVRADVHQALAGVECILHAGDVGGDEVLAELRLIAPVLAVFGNTDPVGAPNLAAEVVIDIAGVSIHVSHGHELGSPTPKKLLDRYPQQVLVFGHTHRELVERSGERWVINPGAAGPRRFNVMPTVARLSVGPSGIEVSVLALNS